MGVDFNKIKSLREKLGLTMEQAADAAGFSGRQAWYNVESGRQPDLRISTLEAIAKALGVSAKSLLAEPK